MLVATAPAEFHVVCRETSHLVPSGLPKSQYEKSLVESRTMVVIYYTRAGLILHDILHALPKDKSLWHGQSSVEQSE